MGIDIVTDRPSQTVLLWHFVVLGAVVFWVWFEEEGRADILVDHSWLYLRAACGRLD